MRGPISNQQFADTDEAFRAACKAAGVEPTRRRASKWRVRMQNHGVGYLWHSRTQPQLHSNSKVAVAADAIDVSIDVPVNVLAK